MSRFKPKGGSTPEVHTARSKLDGVLQTLRDKKDDSPGEDVLIKEEEDDEEIDILGLRPRGRERNQLSGSRKRKRPRDDWSPPETINTQSQFHHTYVMKLFDRSVDLAQFEENTALYPVCRAWMKNQPLNRNLGIRERTRTPSPDVFGLPEDENDVRDCYELPPPIPMLKTEGSKPLRVPTPVQDYSAGPLDIHADPDSAPAPEQLLLDHLLRWKQTREKWRQYRTRKDAVYAPSLTVLKDMFERANNS